MQDLALSLLSSSLGISSRFRSRRNHESSREQSAALTLTRTCRTVDQPRSKVISAENAAEVHRGCVWATIAEIRKTSWRDCPRRPPTSHPPGRRTPLDGPIQIARHPPTIETPRLRPHQLIVNIAPPRPCVERHISRDVLVALCGTSVRPYPIFDGMAWRTRAADGIIRCTAFPFTECGFLGGC